MNRYPAPDPSDPWAPLWVLRSKAATASSRPSTAESDPLPPPVIARSTRPRSSPGYLSGSASRPFDSRRRYTVTTPSTASPLASSVVLSASPPQSPRSSHSRPSLPSPLDAINQEENRQQTPEIGSKDQARARELVDVRVHDKTRKRSQGKFSRIILGSIKTSTSTSSTPGHKERRSSTIALPRKRTSSQPGPSPQHHYQNHYQHAHSHHRALSSNGRPTISSPVISTLVWESQMTDRKFVPIAASPILNNATSVQQPQPQQQENVGTPFNGALNDTSANPAGMAIVGSDARCYTNGTNGIKSPAPSTSSRPLSPPHHRPSSDMHDDSGVELQDSQDRPVASASPLTPRKRVPSLILSPITVTASQRSSQSSYFEVFSTPCASPVESEDTLKEGTSQPTTIAAPLPSSPFGPPRSPLSSPNTVLLHPPMPDANTSATQTPQSASSTKAQCLCSTTISVPIFQRPVQTEWSIPSSDQLAYAASLPVYQSDGTPIEFGSLFTEHRTIVLFLRHFFCPMCQDYVQDLAELIKQPALKETGALCPFDEEDARVPLTSDEDGEGQALPKQVQLVLVSCGKASLVGKYKSMFDLPFRMFTDPEMKVYEALGMGKMGRSGVGVGGGVNLDKPHHSAQHAHTAAHAEVVEDVIMTAAAEGVTEKNLATEVEEPVVRTISPMATVTRRSIDIGNSNSNGSSYVKHGLMGGIGMVVMRALKAGMPIWENGGDIAQLGGEFVLGPGMTCAFAHRMQHPKGHAPVLEVLKAANVNIPDEIMRTLGVSRATSLTSISDSDISSMEFAPPSTVRGVPGPSKPTVPPQGKENKLNKKSSNSFSGLSSSASTVRRSGSFKTLSSLVLPSPQLHGASLRGHGSSNARAMKRLGISSSSIDGNHSPSSRGKKSPRPQQHYRAHSSTLSQILGLGSDRNEDRHTRSAPAVTEPRPSKKATIIISNSDTRSLMDAEEEQKWMESRQRDLEVLRLRKDTRRRTGTPGSVSLSLGSGQASASMSSSPVKGGGEGVEAEHGGGLLSESQEYGVAGSPSSEVDSGYGTGPSNTNGRSAGGVASGKGYIVDENGVLIRPRGEVFVHELPSPSEDGDTIKAKSKSRTKSFSASVRRIFKV